MSETRHARRARFHQSWYRAFRLGVLDWGQTIAGRPIGSILPPDAADAGKNFTSTASRELFAERRLQGWGVDPVRMTSHMTSSQTLLMNMLGPLADDRSWLLKVLRGVLQRPDLGVVLDVEVEFAPAARSRYLADMTRVDAFIRVASATGTEGIVLELKYTDRFSSRRLAIAENVKYVDLAESTGLWRAPTTALSDDTCNQLLRCHALGARTLQVEHDATMPVTLLLVSHPRDISAGVVFDRYRSHLTDPRQALHVRLDRLLDAASATSSTAAGSAAIDELRLRYLDHDASESLWREFVGAVSPRGGDGAACPPRQP